jgi:Mg2+ and Co2+ transporter CorA
MDAKQYLKRITRLDSLIKAKLEQIEELRSLAEKATVEAKLVKIYNKNSYQSDRVGDIVAKIVDLNNEINEYIDQLIDLKAEAVRLIDSLENPDYRLLLNLRYINGYTFERIAVEMNYCYRWITELHGRALEAFNGVLQEFIETK